MVTKIYIDRLNKKSDVYDVALFILPLTNNHNLLNI
jgi:hypothetical protein